MNYEKMPFGKYKGELIQDIPTNYLVYSYQEFEMPFELKETIQLEICCRLNFDPDISYLQKSISKIYKDLSKKYHPDLGGNTQAMQAINEFRTLLNKIGNG